MSQGKPVRNQPRTHSANTQPAGKITSSLRCCAAGCGRCATRATPYPSAAGNSARNSTKKLVRNSDRLSDTPPLSYMLPNTLLAPKPNMPAPYVNPRRIAWRGGAGGRGRGGGAGGAAAGGEAAN